MTAIVHTLAYLVAIAFGYLSVTLLWYAIAEVPTIASPGPIILGLACAFIAYRVWPRRWRTSHR